jgi:hypothetical protein
VESPPVSDDEPIAPGEEPPQRESHRRRNQRRNIRRHHEAGDRDPAQPVSRDEVSEMGETPEERVFRDKRNSRRRDRRRAQEQAEQEARQRQENPLFGRNLNPDFARAMNTPSEFSGVLARVADGLPRTPDAEGYRRLLTRAANHLLPLALPPSDLRHAINSRRDAQSSINASREQRHENEIRRQEEYDRDHGVPAWSQATRVESATASTGGTTRGRSRHHDDNSPPRDRHHHRRHEDTCGLSALTLRLRAIQWPPNFKVSNVDKYEPKQDPGGWLAVYTTAVRAAGATEDVMTAYLPIVLRQDALQWLRHLPRHCIDDWSDFSRRLTANFQSLSDKPAQPWDLKSIKRRGDETLRSYLKRFQTMRNRIPEVAEAAMIEDFYRGSNDSAFVRTILQKAPTTSEQLFWEADLYITADERAQDLIGGTKPAPAVPQRDTNQQSDKRWEKRPREEVDAAGPPASRSRGAPHGGERTLDDILDTQCPYHKDMRHTLRNFRDFKHSVGNGRPFQPLPPPPPQGAPGEPRQPQQQEGGGGGSFPRVDGEVNIIFGGHGSQESKRQQKLNDHQILVATTGPPAPYQWSEHPITFTRADQWLNFDHPGKYPLLIDPVIRESRVKKVLVDGGSSINVTFPRTLQGLGVTLKELHESDTPFFGIVPTEGEYPLGHIYMSVTFGTLENYRTEYLRFEVANFDCGYNAIVGRPGLAKFMVILNYMYMILKMPGPQGIITVRADFQGAAECFRVAIQAALTTKPPTTSSAHANSKPEEDLAVPANEAQAVTSMRPTEETKRINLGFADERKTAIICSSLDDK